MKITIGSPVFILAERAKSRHYDVLRDQRGAVVGFIGGHAYVSFDAQVMEAEHRRGRHRHTVALRGVTHLAFRIPLAILRTRHMEYHVGEWQQVEYTADGRRGTVLVSLGSRPGIVRMAVQTANSARAITEQVEAAERGRAADKPFHLKVGDTVRRVGKNHGIPRCGVIGTVGVITGTNEHNKQRAVNSYRVELSNGSYVFWQDLYCELVKPAAATREEKARDAYLRALKVKDQATKEADAARKAVRDADMAVQLAHNALCQAANDMHAALADAAGVKP